MSEISQKPPVLFLIHMCYHKICKFQKGLAIIIIKTSETFILIDLFTFFYLVAVMQVEDSLMEQKPSVTASDIRFSGERG